MKPLRLKKQILLASAFLLFSSTASLAGIVEKWKAVSARTLADIETVLQCAPIGTCQKGAAVVANALANMKGMDDKAMMRYVNKLVNTLVRYKDDGPVDIWSSPLETLDTMTGDCEDYAIAKYAILRAAGFDHDRIRIVVGEVTLKKEWHANVMVKVDNDWWVLDNRHLMIPNAADTGPFFKAAYFLSYEHGAEF